MVEYLLLLWSITSKRMNFLLLWFKFSACKLTTNTSHMQFADLNMCFPDHISRTESAPSQILVGNRKWNGCLLQSPLKSRTFLFLRECAKLSKPQWKRWRPWIKPSLHSTEWHFTGVLLCDLQFQLSVSRPLVSQRNVTGTSKDTLYF